MGSLNPNKFIQVSIYVPFFEDTKKERKKNNNLRKNVMFGIVAFCEESLHTYTYISMEPKKKIKSDKVLK